MSKKLKLMPAFVTLLACAVTSIITYFSDYEGKTACLILLAVLLFFYTLTNFLQKLIFKYERQNAKEAAEKAEAEGKVVEKDRKDKEKDKDKETEKKTDDSKESEMKQEDTESKAQSESEDSQN